MNDELKNFGITTTNIRSTKSFSERQKLDKSQLFMPE